MAKLKLRTTILSKLSTLTRNEGNLVITRDGESLYFDTDSKRFKISDFIDVADDNDRLAILAPNTEKMYYVLSTDAVWRYISGSWHEVTSTEDISDILTAISGKADSNKAYLTDDSVESVMADDDYVPFYDTSASAKKKSTFSNLVAKIKAKLITDTYSGTSTNGMSGKAVKSAIDALDGNLNNTTPSASKTLTAFSQTDGKVSATFGDINISKSQINDFPTIPTVNNATLTIQKNGTNVQTFTANASSDKTANITVPVTQADLTEIRLTNEDLDNVTYPGFYYAGGGNTVTNKPTGYNNFGLVVIHNASGSQYTQIISNENGSYRRIKKANGTWTSWAEDNFTDTTYTAGTGLSLTGNEISVDKVPIENGGTNATTRLTALKNLTNQNVATPTYVFGMTNSWATGGYVSIANLKSTIGLGATVPSDAVFTDTQVTQTNNNTNTYLPILLANSTTSPETATVKKNTNLTANPSNGYMDVNSLRIHSNVADHNSNFARLYCANTGDKRYKLPVDKANDSELAVVSDIPTQASDIGALPNTTKYAASSSVGGSATTAEKLSNTSKVGNTNRPVYFTASGVPAQISYTIDKSVPSNAVFTDENVTQTQIGASDTGWYKLLLSDTTPGTLTGGTNKTDGVAYKRSTPMLSIDSADGVAGTAKINYLKIGNETASDTDGNTQGDIRLCSSNSGYIDIRLANTTQKRVVTFPDPGSGNKTVMYQSNMGTSELVTGTATTTRTVRADYLNAAIKQLIDDHEASKSCIVGSDASANLYFHVCTIKLEGLTEKTDVSVMFSVNNTFSSNTATKEGAGILYMHVRADTTNANESMALKFVSNVNFSNDDFKLGYSRYTSGGVTGIQYELWTKIDTRWMFRRFTVLSQGYRKHEYDNIITLDSDTTGSSTLPSRINDWISAS